MNKMLNLILAAMLVLALNACSTATKEKLGMTKKAPNEFMVSPRPPLSLPPEFDLRPVTEPQPEVNQVSARLTSSEQSLISQVENN